MVPKIHITFFLLTRFILTFSFSELLLSFKFNKCFIFLEAVSLAECTGIFTFDTPGKCFYSPVMPLPFNILDADEKCYEYNSTYVTTEAKIYRLATSSMCRFA